MTELAAPVLPEHIKKPNEEEYKKALETVNANIKKTQEKYDAFKNLKNGDSRRDAIKAELEEIRGKQAELKKSRKEIFDQMDVLKESINEKTGPHIKIDYKTTEEVDARIAQLEREIETDIRIVEERKILKEISFLKRNRESVEANYNLQVKLDKEKGIRDELKNSIDRSGAKELSDRYDALDAEFKAISTERNKHYDERNKLKRELDEEYAKMRTLRDDHRKNNDEYYTFVRQLKEFKREQEALRKKQEETEKRQEAAKQELELASLPAFESEIILCDTLTRYLEGFVSSGEKADQTIEPTPTSVTEAFDGMVIKKKDDEDFFAGSSKKYTKKNKTSRKENKSDALKLSLTTMEDFFRIKVTVPTKTSEIPSALEKLKERKAYYVNEQPQVTESNKKKAQERIEAMNKQEEETKKAEATAATTTTTATASATTEEKAE